MNAFYLKTFGVLVAVALTFAFAGAYKSTTTVQRGNPGLAMEVIDTNKRIEERARANVAPPSLPPATQEGQLAIDAYKNVQVLGHITSGEMTRLMTQMTLWVSPKQGCAYCHAPQRDAAGNVVKDADGNPQADANNLNSDELYTKRVARRMLQMTMHINSEWKTHVAETGVTCYTCHRGNPVPSYIWYDQPEDRPSAGMLGNPAGQNKPAPVVGLTSLPSNPFQTFLNSDEGIRILSTEALPIDNRASIKQAEWTYGLMMHISSALGVNCTYCHNTRSMAAWSVSPVARSTAWYGIRMVRELNKNYLEPLLANFPPERLGPLGDVPKINCATCHQGAYKPLLGVSMLKDNMVLAEAKPQPQKTVVPPPAAPAPGTEPSQGTLPAPGADAPATAPAPTGTAPAPTGTAPAAAPAPTGAAPGTAPAPTGSSTTTAPAPSAPTPSQTDPAGAVAPAPHG